MPHKIDDLIKSTASLCKELGSQMATASALEQEIANMPTSPEKTQKEADLAEIQAYIADIQLVLNQSEPIFLREAPIDEYEHPNGDLAFAMA